MEGDNVRAMSRAELEAEVELVRAKLTRLSEELQGCRLTMDQQRAGYQSILAQSDVQGAPFGFLDLQTWREMHRRLRTLSAELQKATSSKTPRGKLHKVKRSPKKRR